MAEVHLRDPIVMGEGSGVVTGGNGDLYEVNLEDGGAPKACAVAKVKRGGTQGSSKMSSMEEECIREKIRTNLLRECSNILAADNTLRYTKETFRRIFQEKDLLERLFRLFDHDRDNLLVQEDWVEFLKARLTDEKQIDFAEQVESVTYVLCGDGNITLERFFQVFKAKGILDKLFRLVDLDSDGVVTPDQIMEFLATLSNARPRSGFEKGNLEWLEQLFRQTVGNEPKIKKDDFKKIVISKNPFFTDRAFQIFDKDKDGSISLQEFIDTMHQFAGESPDHKMKFLFRVYDLDEDGLIQHRELQHVMRACMEENGMKFSDDQIENLTMALFEDADSENRGAITYEALKNQLEKHGGLLENLSISIDRWLVPPKPQAAPKSVWGKLTALRPYQLSRPYMKNNYVYLIFVAVFFVINVGLFISRAFQYRKSNGYVIVARACGQCLNFNCMFVLVVMLRGCITFLRTRGFSMFLPLDQHIYFHKVTGLLIFLFGILHTIVHLINFGVAVVPDPVVNKGNFTFYEWILTSDPGLFGLVPGAANPTGVALVIILVVMFLCSQPFVRRGGSFEIFYFTHLMYIPFWLLLIFHGPNFWKWFIVPGIIYLIERIVRLINMRTNRGKTYISSGILLPSRVTHLVIKRPQHFDFHPGDYVFVNIPAIAKYEWHPFTISSAPEQEESVWLHIRTVGEWTNRLYDYFEKEQLKLQNADDSSLDPISRRIQNGNVENSKLKRIQVKFAGESKDSANRKKSVGFKNDSSPSKSGSVNESFVGDDMKMSTSMQPITEGEQLDESTSTSNDSVMLTGNGTPSRKITPEKEKKFNLFLMSRKTPLSKSLSMPDIQTRMKKRERLLVLRDYMRSESEKSFDEAQMKRARLQSLGLAYLSPQNKCVAQSFRYMRHKPTIIAFKTPSVESYEAMFHKSPEKVVEEGGMSMTNVDPNKKATPINYPFGKPLEIFIDGPYGAPSSHIFSAQHAVLIGTGIGVTPFASILQSIMHRYWKARHSCPKCKFSWASDIPPTVMNLRKVDFFWINRDQRSFEWFVNLLSQLEIEQAELGGAMERFLEMHMYITSALQKTDMKAVGLQLALDLLHEKEKRDLITGLKTRTIAGRPNWDKVFKQILDQKKGKVTVFYCGPPQLGRILRIKCDQFGFSFRKEVF